jgi:hypothetical protein
MNSWSECVVMKISLERVEARHGNSHGVSRFFEVIRETFHCLTGSAKFLGPRLAAHRAHGWFGDVGSTVRCCYLLGLVRLSGEGDACSIESLVGLG